MVDSCPVVSNERTETKNQNYPNAIFSAPLYRCGRDSVPSTSELERLVRCQRRGRMGDEDEPIVFGTIFMADGLPARPRVREQKRHCVSGVVIREAPRISHPVRSAKHLNKFGPPVFACSPPLVFRVPVQYTLYGTHVLSVDF